MKKKIFMYTFILSVIVPSIFLSLIRENVRVLSRLNFITNITRRVRITNSIQQIIQDYLSQNREEVEFCFDIELSASFEEKIIKIGSYLNARKDDLEDFFLVDLKREIKRELNIEVTPGELRNIIGIIMQIEKPYIIKLYSEILESDGSPSEELALRDEIIHAKGRLHGSSNVLIFRKFDGNWYVLLQKRAQDKFLFPGKFSLSAAGNIDPGMGSFQVAVKETVEEIKVNDIELIEEYGRNNLNRIGKELEYDGYVKQCAFEYNGQLDLETKEREIKDMLKQKGYKFDNIFFYNFEEKDKKLIAYFIFDKNEEGRFDKIKDMLEKDTALTFASSSKYSPYNREKKSFYIYI